MTLYQKSKAVDALFLKLDKEISVFAAQHKIHCLVGCGKCCTTPNIEATVLEFLPMAMHYFLSGQAEQKLVELQSSESICHVFTSTNADTGAGFCSNYTYRGLVCRLFGYSAFRQKTGALQLYTCNSIKQFQAQQFQKATEGINAGSKIPVVADYYRRLSNIDSNLTGKQYPVNIAARKAVEEVLSYYAYRRPPRILKRAS